MRQKEESPKTLVVLRLFGTPERIRTSDLSLRSSRKYSFKKPKQLLNFSYIHWFF